MEPRRQGGCRGSSLSRPPGPDSRAGLAPPGQSGLQATLQGCLPAPARHPSSQSCTAVNCSTRSPSGRLAPGQGLRFWPSRGRASTYTQGSSQPAGQRAGRSMSRPARPVSSRWAGQECPPICLAGADHRLPQTSAEPPALVPRPRQHASPRGGLPAASVDGPWVLTHTCLHLRPIT